VGLSRGDRLNLENVRIARNRCQSGNLQVGSAQQEIGMKLRWIVVAAAGLAVIAADPAVARAKQKAHRQCDDRPQTFTWGGFITNPAPQPNGCVPPVYEYGKYVGQDPDPFIRSQLRRDPATGMSPY
jgi:hypothetical protein